MNSAEVAKHILGLRNTSHVIAQGSLIAEIGREALVEALNNRWVVPDDSGYLMVSCDHGKISEMTEVSESTVEEEIKVDDSAGLGLGEKLRVYHDLVGEHIDRPGRGCVSSINEIAAPATGGQSPGMPGSNQQSNMSNPQQAQTASSATPASDSGGYNVGDSVGVVENGKTYVGKVSKVDGDKYVLSFGSQSPGVQRDYTSKELSSAIES